METKGNIVCFLQSFNFVFIIQEFKLNLNVSSSTSATNWTDVTIPEHTHTNTHREKKTIATSCVSTSELPLRPLAFFPLFHFAFPFIHKHTPVQTESIMWDRSSFTLFPVFY